MCFERYHLVLILCIAKYLKCIYTRYQDEVIMITLAICTGPWKAAKIISFFDVMLYLKKLMHLVKIDLFWSEMDKLFTKEILFWWVLLEVHLESQKLWGILANIKLSFNNPNFFFVIYNLTSISVISSLFWNISHFGKQTFDQEQWVTRWLENMVS